MMKNRAGHARRTPVATANVVSMIVAADLCTGCGVCAGVCPFNALEMQMHRGAYTPVLTGACSPRCQVCLASCPFAEHDGSIDQIAQTRFWRQDSIQYDVILGYYLDCYIGYSLVRGQLANGASGGMVTWTLERLIEAPRIPP